MYAKIKSEISQDYYQQKFPNDGQRFLAWYLRNIHGLDEIEAKDCITDGSDDKQIDAIFVNDESQIVYVLQGKFIGALTVDAEPLREVLSSWTLLKNLVPLQDSGNQKLRQKLAELSLAIENGYDIHFELITTSSLSESAKKDFIEFQQQFALNEESNSELFLVDNEEIARRYDMSLDKDDPFIEHSLQIDKDKLLTLKLGNTSVAIAAIPLKQCIGFPGIKDGSLFKKNVRQTLGLKNPVNKQMKDTIYNYGNDFFFYHNGVTVICQSIAEAGNILHLKGVSVVNGCQSLNTILSCSEKVKELEDAYIMFRFYEIPERTRSDKISIATNSQSAVKARDLRSNDKRVLSIKRSYEQKFTDGYMITKRGEKAPANKDNRRVIDLSDLGKFLMAWHSQRPNISYSETNIFDRYFEQLFKRDYSPENINALNELSKAVFCKWVKNNPLSLNESLLAMKAYAPYHHLYAVSAFIARLNNASDRVPNPYASFEALKSGNLLEQVVTIAGTCLNTALEAAANEPQIGNRVFSPQNWIKTKGCLGGIRAAILQYINMLPAMPGGTEMLKSIRNALILPSEFFEERWSAD